MAGERISLTINEGASVGGLEGFCNILSEFTSKNTFTVLKFSKEHPGLVESFIPPKNLEPWAGPEGGLFVLIGQHNWYAVDFRPTVIGPWLQRTSRPRGTQITIALLEHSELPDNFAVVENSDDRLEVDIRLTEVRPFEGKPWTQFDQINAYLFGGGDPLLLDLLHRLT